MQQPGRPRWALAAGTLLLLGTVAMAYALIQSKTRARIVELAPQAQVFPQGQLQVRLPAEWSTVQEGPLAGANGVVVAVRPNHEGEVAVAFRGVPRPLGIPSQEGASGLRHMAELVLHALTQTNLPASPSVADPGPVQESVAVEVSGLPGWRLVCGPGHILGQQVEVYSLGVALLAPDGQTAGVVVLVPRVPRAEDRRLLDELAASLQLTSVGAVADLSAEMAAAGIVADLPAGVRAVRSTLPGGEPIPRLRLFGGQDAGLWYLDVYRVVMVAERSPATLLEDYAAGVEPTYPASNITTYQAGERDAARCLLPIQGRPQADVRLWAARVDPRTGLLLVGRHERDAGAVLQAIGDRLMTEAQVADITDRVDPAAARTQGLQWMAELAAEGLTGEWAALSDKPERMVERWPAGTGYHELTSYTPIRSDGGPWWQIDVNSGPPGPMVGGAAHEQERWSVREDGGAHAGQRIKRPGVGREPSFKYTELRAPGDAALRCELEVPHHEAMTWRIPLDDVYACQPVLGSVLAKVAWDPQRRPALFTTSSYTTRHLTRLVAIPLEPAVWLGHAQPEAAVLCWQDHDPTPIYIYFDDGGHPIAHNMDHIFWLEPYAPAGTRSAQPDRQPPSF